MRTKDDLIKMTDSKLLTIAAVNFARPVVTEQAASSAALVLTSKREKEGLRD